MKKKKFVIVLATIILILVAISLVGCVDTPIGGATVADLNRLADLNVCLGYGILLPNVEADIIRIEVSRPHVLDGIEDNPHCVVDDINRAYMCIDEYDLNIEVNMTRNCNNVDEVEEIEGYEVVEIGGRKTIKKFASNTKSIIYSFVDRLYVYEVICVVDFETTDTNKKTKEENIQVVEDFISNFTRYSYYKDVIIE